MKTGFDGLRAVVRDLAGAQRRTGLRVEELAGAQRRTGQMLQEGLQKLRDSIATLGRHWGIQTGDVFRRAMESLLARGAARCNMVIMATVRSMSCCAMAGICCSR